MLRREDAVRAKELARIVTQQSVLFLDGLLSQVPGTGTVNTDTQRAHLFTPYIYKEARINWDLGRNSLFMDFFMHSCMANYLPVSQCVFSVDDWKHIRGHILANRQIVSVQTVG